MSTPSMVTFVKPPLNEVVLGHVFVPRTDFLIPHFGRFWHTLLPDYERCEHALPVVNQTDPPPVDLVTGTVFPRIWFIGRDDSSLLQLQQDRLYVNWRQTEKNGEYGRFPKLRAEYERISGLFERYLERAGLPPVQTVRLELSYINAIPQGEGWTCTEDIGNVVEGFSTPLLRRLPKVLKNAFQAEYDANENTRITLRLAQGTRIKDEVNILRFEISAASIAAVADHSRWISEAHDVVVNIFKDVTTPQMHELWQLQKN